MHTISHKDNLRPCSLWRRLCANLYDSLLIFGLWITSTAIIVLFCKGKPIPPNNLLYQAFLFLLPYFFIVWFWSAGGQTGGMAAWRIFLLDEQNNPPSFARASLRYLLAFLTYLSVIGLFAILFNKEKRSLYDKYSNTHLVVIPK